MAAEASRAARGRGKSRGSDPALVRVGVGARVRGRIKGYGEG